MVGETRMCCAMRIQVCRHCGGGGGRRAAEGGIVCDSLDCGVFFEYKKASSEAAAARALCDLALQGFRAAARSE